MPSDDMTLVREFAQSNSEQAFATLVSRHINLVYSIALRQVGDPHLAEEITQTVFIVLARKAKSLSPKTILSGWLCRTARYVSADTLKTQRRRHMREQESHMQSMLNEPDSDAWKQIAPFLDEALNCLGELEHNAIVLRFFEGKDLKQVGTTLGMREDAARMRINRGLEKLRKFFGRKGVTLSAAAIAAAVSAHSMQAAPAALQTTIATAVISGGTLTTAAISTAKTIAMTTLQKTAISATLAVAVAAGIYEAHQATNARAEVNTLRQQQTSSFRQIQQLQNELKDATNRLASLTNEKKVDPELLRLRAEVTRLRKESGELAKLKAGGAGSTPQSDVKALFERMRLLKTRLLEMPEQAIPELQFLNEEAWLQEAAYAKQLETDDDFRTAFGALRGSATGTFLRTLEKALRQYIEVNNNQFPTDLSQLKPYAEKTVTDDILQRYHIVPASSIPAASSMRDAGDWLITPSTMVSTNDNFYYLGRNGSGTFGHDEDELVILGPAMRALFDDTPPDIHGNKKVDVHQLESYLKTPQQKAAYQRWMQKK
jgi:RNA polymerase sigma factor (sigma-70 family)